MVIWECELSDANLKATIVSQQRQQIERSEEHTSELQSPCNIVYRLLLEKKNSVNVLCIDVASQSVDLPPGWVDAPSFRRRHSRGGHQPKMSLQCTNVVCTHRTHLTSLR